LERVRDIDNNLKTKGAAVLDEAYLVSSEDEMDATYASSEIGVTNYSAGIYLVRDRLNANPAYKDNPVTLPEVFNRQRTANNLKSGRKAPLIMPNATQDSLASLPTKLLKLFEDNKPPMMKRRGQEMIKSHILGTPLPRRGETNIGPTSLKAFAPQVSSVTFDTGQPGIDVFFEDKNFPSVLSGSVKDIGYQVNPDGSGYGNYLVIESIDPDTGELVDVLYGHLETKPSQSIGQNINSGEIIGKQGGTGSVQSADGTIASIDFLSPAPRGSKSMTPYKNYDSLRRTIASQFQ
jgi:hypothetical protein